MPLTKIRLNQFSRISLDQYTTLVMVSGSYNHLRDSDIEKIKDWVGKGNTLIKIARGSSWVINKKIVDETLVKRKKDTIFSRKNYVDARENIGRERIGGVILSVDFELETFAVFWNSDGYSPEEEGNVAKWSNSELFVILNHGRKANDI